MIIFQKKKNVDWLCPLSEEDEARHGGACGTTCGIAIFQCFAPLCAVVVLPEDCEFVIAVQFTMFHMFTCADLSVTRVSVGDVFLFHGAAS